MSSSAKILLESNVMHVHMRNEVRQETVMQLKEAIFKAKPSRGVLMHINSPGGSMKWGLSLINVFKDAPPKSIHVIVNGAAYSMAALITILAPSPRYMTDVSTMLLHNWSATFDGRKEDINLVSKATALQDDAIEDRIVSRSKISRQALRLLLGRDRIISAQEALEYGFIDVIVPVINVPFSQSRSRRNSSTSAASAASTSVQHVQLPNGFWTSQDDDSTTTKEHQHPSIFLCMQPGASDAKQSDCDLIALRNVHSRKGIVLHISDIIEYDIVYLRSFPATFAPLFATIRALSMRQAVLGVLDSPVNLITASLLQACSRRAMHKDSYILTHLIYERASGMLVDVVDNSKQLFALLRAILVARCRIPETVLAKLETDRILWSADECLAYGIVDEIIE